MVHMIPEVPGFKRVRPYGNSVYFLSANGNVTVTVTALGRTAPYGCWSADWRGVDSTTLDAMAEAGSGDAARCRAEIDAACDALRDGLGDWPKDWAPFTLA